MDERRDPLSKASLLAEHDGRALDVAQQIVDTQERFPKAVGRSPDLGGVVHGENLLRLAAKVACHVVELVYHVLTVTHSREPRGLSRGIVLSGLADHDEIFYLHDARRPLCPSVRPPEAACVQAQTLLGGECGLGTQSPNFASRDDTVVDNIIRQSLIDTTFSCF